ncbi:hypothetical protein KJA17_02170, partial [Patescibacteria group bacterium]|nr:hypothetical protein [Patescibacteria group bacterium]
FFLLFLFLKKKIKPPPFWERAGQEILSSLKKVLPATLLMTILTFLWLQISSTFLNLQTFLGIFSQTFSALFIGAGVYLLFSLFLKSKEPKVIIEAIKKQFK